MEPHHELILVRLTRDYGCFEIPADRCSPHTSCGCWYRNLARGLQPRLLEMKLLQANWATMFSAYNKIQRTSGTVMRAFG